MDRLDKVIGYLKSNTTSERSDGDQLIQLACNCIKYADFYTGRSSKNWTAIYIEYNSIFRPSKETIRKNKKLWETIEQNVSIQRCENGFNAEIKNLDLTFLNDIK